MDEMQIKVVLRDEQIWLKVSDRTVPIHLLLDAGDIFQGTPYFNYYGGELEFKLMSMLKYDLATIGNHDFDNGIDGLICAITKC